MISWFCVLKKSYHTQPFFCNNRLYVNQINLNINLMKITLLLSATLLMLFVVACKKETVTNNTVDCALVSDSDYLEFGIAYGFCPSNCSYLYRLTNKAVFPDNIEHLDRNQTVTYSNTPLNDAKLATATEICKAFPTALLSEDKEIIGCPDCYDQGTVYVAIKRNGKLQKWFIDPSKQEPNVPDYLKTYVQKIKDAVEVLRK